MKLVIGGSTGYVSTELIRQGLPNQAITSIVALGRRSIQAPPEAEAFAAKLTSVVLDDFEKYSDSVKREIEGADACIWTIAVTPSKLKTLPFEQTCKISRDYATTAIRTLSSLHKKDAPLRFIYMSGHFAPRSAAEVPEQLKNHDMVNYGLLRGEAESLILGYAEQSNGVVQSCVVKPGLIDSPSRPSREIPGLPHVQLSDIAAALLDQVVNVNGFEKDTLSNDDLARIGQKALAEQGA